MDPVGVMGRTTLQATNLSAAGRHPKVPSGWNSSSATWHHSAVRSIVRLRRQPDVPTSASCSARIWSGPLPGVVR